MGYIYKITNNINGKIYIGKTHKDVLERFNQHIKCSRENKDNSLLHKAIRKYGESNFTIKTLLKEIPNEKLDYYEKLYISKFKSMFNQKGYNLTEGGEGIIGYKFTEEQKQKVSLTSKRMWENFRERGIHNISKVNKESLIKRGKNALWRKHISEARMGKFKGAENPFYNKRHTKETKDLISMKKSKLKVAMYDKENNLLKIFINCNQARNWLNENKITNNLYAESLIHQVCKQSKIGDNYKHKTAYGFIWKYYDSVETNCDECSSVE